MAIITLRLLISCKPLIPLLTIIKWIHTIHGDQVKAFTFRKWFRTMFFVDQTRSNAGHFSNVRSANDASPRHAKAWTYRRRFNAPCPSPFEDHKIARRRFLVPDNCGKESTRAFLLFLEQQGLIESAAAIEWKAILAGRHFSQIRFPPD
jgi:hypothetical protein